MKNLPSGKLTQLWKITIFNGKIHYKLQFSIAMLNYQRVVTVAISRKYVMHPLSAVLWATGRGTCQGPAPAVLQGMKVTNCLNRQSQRHPQCSQCS